MPNKIGLSSKQKEVLLYVTQKLNRLNIDYQVSGGTAAILYGVSRETEDIDIDLHKFDIPKVVELFKEYVSEEYHHYSGTDGSDFDLWLLNLEISSVPVEFGQAEGAKIRASGSERWLDLPDTIGQATTIAVENHPIRIQRIDDLIQYKKILGRDVDKFDVAELEKHKL